MSQVRPSRRNLMVWVALLVLLAISAGSAFVPMGGWNTVVNLGIAAAKIALVACFFMHLREAGALLRLVAAVALFMLAILIGLSATDYRSRVVYPAPWQAPQQIRPVGPGPP